MTIIYLASISIELGKGALKHNSRIFNTPNTNPERSHLNKEYINDDIKNVYHELFDEAVERYNSKQTRNDRKVKNYYEKICNGKQEKPFYEIVVQIGNKNDFGIDKQTTGLAEKALDNYVSTFQKRNPYLRVFSAHMHLDEATPHLHIDFVPFTTGSSVDLIQECR
ncbi:plasmid recombination protein [Eubacterium sp.]